MTPGFSFNANVLSVFYFTMSSDFNFSTLKLPGFSLFLDSLLEERVLHKEAWVAGLLGTHLRIQVHKKVKFSGRDISSLAVKGLMIILDFENIFQCYINTNLFF